MAEDTNVTTTETTDADTALAANQSGAQTATADAGTGTVDTATSSGADQDDSSSITQTSSEVAIKRVGEQLRSQGGMSNQNAAPAGSAQATASAITMEQISEALGIKTPDDIKRIANERSLLGRQANELGQVRKQLAQFEQQSQAERQRQEQEAQRQSLSPFHAKHPQFQTNQARIAKANAFNSASAVLNPQDPNYQQMRSQMAASMGVTGEDLKMASEAKSYQERIIAEQASDPEGFVESRAMRVVQAQLQQFEQYLNNRFQTQQFIQQHQDLIKDPRSQQVMAEVLNEGTSRADLAVRIANLEREKAELLGRAKAETVEVENLRARDALATGQVTAKRRASTDTTTQRNPWDSYEKTKDDPKAHEKLIANLFQR
jgi:hypothetical protein